ncbi:MAG: hypothetical protein EA427_03855, partial [Spirochaetaceae bacterium]
GAATGSDTGAAGNGNDEDAPVGRGGFVVAPWDGDPVTEARIKEETRATIRVLPPGNEQDAQGRSCIFSGKPARYMAVFAKAY